MTDNSDLRDITENLALPKYRAGRVLGWGRRATDQAVAAGQLLRKKLQIETT